MQTSACCRGKHTAKVAFRKGNFSVKSGKFGKVYQVNMMGFRFFCGCKLCFFSNFVLQTRKSPYLAPSLSISGKEIG